MCKFYMKFMFCTKHTNAINDMKFMFCIKHTNAINANAINDWGIFNLKVLMEGNFNVMTEKA